MIHSRRNVDQMSDIAQAWIHPSNTNSIFCVLGQPNVYSILQHEIHEHSLPTPPPTLLASVSFAHSLSFQPLSLSFFSISSLATHSVSWVLEGVLHTPFRYYLLWQRYYEIWFSRPSDIICWVPVPRFSWWAREGRNTRGCKKKHGVSLYKSPIGHISTPMPVQTLFSHTVCMPQHGVIMKSTSFETDTSKALLFPSSNSSQTYSLHHQTGIKNKHFTEKKYVIILPVFSKQIFLSLSWPDI